MNYMSIHDSIICRARSRIQEKSKIYESHHITPKCEGGLSDGDQVLLTQKEHRIVHKLRYKMTGVYGNIMAYNLMGYGRSVINDIRKEISIIGGKAHHYIWRQKDYGSYIDRQRKSGLIGGNICKDNQLGFFALSETDKQLARSRGNTTLVNNKLGMFSDEYREKHKKLLHKKVHTPDGVFDSMTMAAKHYGVCRSTMTYRINNDTFTEWYLVNKGENK